MKIFIFLSFILMISNVTWAKSTELLNTFVPFLNSANNVESESQDGRTSAQSLGGTRGDQDSADENEKVEGQTSAQSLGGVRGDLDIPNFIKSMKDTHQITPGVTLDKIFSDKMIYFMYFHKFTTEFGYKIESNCDVEINYNDLNSYFDFFKNAKNNPLIQDIGSSCQKCSHEFVQSIAMGMLDDLNHKNKVNFFKVWEESSPAKGKVLDNLRNELILFSGAN